MKTLLHVGSGTATRKDVYISDFQGIEWNHVRVDIDPDVNPDTVDDIRTLSKFRDDSIDGIFSSHNLEHLHDYDAAIALTTFLRVLKPDGICVVCVPDFELACKLASEGKDRDTLYESPAGPICPLDMIYGFRPYTVNNTYQKHLTGFTVKSLTQKMETAGFKHCNVFKGHCFDIVGMSQK